MFQPSLNRALRVVLVALTLCTVTAASIRAATISWGSATNISSDTDVITTGSLIQAWNFGTSVSGTAGSAVNTTVNGVLFTAAGVTPSGTNNVSFINNTSVLGNPTVNLSTSGTVTLAGWNAGVGSASTPFSNLSSSYQSLLSTMAFAGVGTLNPGDPVMNITFSNLVIGRPYLVQVWVNESRSNGSNVQNRSGKIDNVTVDYNTTNSAGGLGQWVSGTFIADATTQSFISSGTSGLPNPAYMNAVQLRLVPEPSSLVIATVGIAACGASLALRSRRRGRAESIDDGNDFLA